MCTQRRSESLEGSEYALRVRRCRPDEDVHVVRCANVAVQNHGPAAYQQKFRLGFAELDQKIREILRKLSQASHQLRQLRRATPSAEAENTPPATTGDI